MGIYVTSYIVKGASAENVVKVLAYGLQLNSKVHAIIFLHIRVEYVSSIINFKVQ